MEILLNHKRYKRSLFYFFESFRFQFLNFKFYNFLKLFIIPFV